MFKFLISLFISFLAVFNTQAGELIVHTVSTHSEKKYLEYSTGLWKEIRNENYGLGYKTDDGYLIGYYQNSTYSDTFYVGKEFMFNQNIGVVTTLATGYKKATGQSIVPMVAAVLRVPVTKDININATFTPPVGSYIGVMHLAFSYKF